MAVLWQAALILQHAPGSVADAYLASRLDGESARTFGTLPTTCARREIVDRAAPRERIAVAP
jgi:putative acyl-CoA dehydrogenase